MAGFPIAGGFFVRKNLNLKWMRTGGAIYGKPHLFQIQNKYLLEMMSGCDSRQSSGRQDHVGQKTGEVLVALRLRRDASHGADSFRNSSLG